MCNCIETLSQPRSKCVGTKGRCALYVQPQQFCAHPPFCLPAASGLSMKSEAAPGANTQGQPFYREARQGPDTHAHIGTHAYTLIQTQGQPTHREAGPGAHAQGQFPRREARQSADTRTLVRMHTQGQPFNRETRQGAFTHKHRHTQRVNLPADRPDEVSTHRVKHMEQRPSNGAAGVHKVRGRRSGWGLALLARLARLDLRSQPLWHSPPRYACTCNQSHRTGSTGPVSHAPCHMSHVHAKPAGH